MVAIAAIAMTIAHPSMYFPEISSHYAQRVELQKRVEEDVELAGHN